MLADEGDHLALDLRGVLETFGDEVFDERGGQGQVTSGFFRADVVEVFLVKLRLI